MNYLKDQNEFNSDDFLKCQEMSELYNFLKHSFSWKAGRYKVEINVSSPEPFILKNNKLEFHLNSIDIEYLEKNKDMIETSFETLKEDKSNKVTWNWKNPLFLK